MVIRLIDTERLCLQPFEGSQIPNYAILSHTWGQDEISFQEMIAIMGDPSHPAAKKPGYLKITKACQKANSGGIRYAWVDTCCIDKTSSSELSEAINSMYQWYQKAEVCYALLGDLDASFGICETDLPRCRWFTRGWCLQELIAPRKVEFFDVNWNYIGTRASLKTLISRITRVDEQVLDDHNLVSSIPVGRRMSWAAGRGTTREEDIAYCLLGIFNVNMPMLYGEGREAFMRLQREIIKTSNDLSIFAFLHGDTSHEHQPSPPYCDLFASSPKDFIRCGRLVQTESAGVLNNAYTLTNNGLHFRQAELQVDVRHGSFSMMLGCKHTETKSARMYLRKVGPGLFARYDDYRSSATVDEVDMNSDKDDRERGDVYVITNVTHSKQAQVQRADEHAIHVMSGNHELSAALQIVQRSASSDRWDASQLRLLTNGARSLEGYWKIFPSLVRRLDGVKAGNPYPSGHFYLACGFENSEPSSTPRAWVRLHSTDEWREIEKKVGIVKHINYARGDIAIGSETSQTRLKTNSGSLTATANIKFVSKNGRPRFEIKLDFEMEPKRRSTSLTKVSPSEHISASDGGKVKVTSLSSRVSARGRNPFVGGSEKANQGNTPLSLRERLSLLRLC